MEYKTIVDKLALSICGKKVRKPQNNECSKIQTQTEIVSTHWSETIHEIAHWIVADEKCKHLPNLGLPTDDDPEESDPIFYRTMYEESIALPLTKLIFDYLSFESPFEDYIKSKDYILYLDSETNYISKLIHLDENSAREKAKEFFEHYKNKIECSIT